MNKMLSSMALLAITGNVLMAGGDIVPVEPAALEESVSDEWKFSASINAWLPDMTIKTAEGDKLTITIRDILKNLNLTLMSTFVAQKGKWGFFTDAVYMNISKGTFVPTTPSIAITNIKMQAWVVTPAVTYRFMESEDLSLDVLAGARYLYVNSPVQINYNKKIEQSGNAWDAIVGLRAKYDLNEKWFMPLHFDVGTGEIDLTWHAFAGVGYKYDNFDVVAGYRHLEFKFDDSDDAGEVFDSITISGPMVGFKYNF